MKSTIASSNLRLTLVSLLLIGSRLVASADVEVEYQASVTA